MYVRIDPEHTRIELVHDLRDGTYGVAIYGDKEPTPVLLDPQDVEVIPLEPVRDGGDKGQG